MQVPTRPQGTMRGVAKGRRAARSSSSGIKSRNTFSLWGNYRRQVQALISHFRDKKMSKKTLLLLLLLLHNDSLAANKSIFCS